MSVESYFAVLIAAPNASGEGALDDSTLAALGQVLRAGPGMPAAGATVGTPRWLGAGEAADLPVSIPAEAAGSLRQALEDWAAGKPFDIALVKGADRRKKLLVADMESTLIENEMLDDLAAEIGIGEQIAAITARSMRGEIDFTTSVKERVAKLKGMPKSVLDRCAARIRPMPGAHALARTMRAHGAYTVIASGGFTYFSEIVSQMLGFDRDVANVLRFDGERLSGTLEEPILDRDGKKQTLLRLAQLRGVWPDETLGVGDGANDLSLIETAGLGVAFRAKPILAAAADARITHGDLTALLYLQGYRKEEFVTG